MVVLMWRATFDGVSKRVWAISSRIVLSRSWPMPVKIGTGDWHRSLARSMSLSHARSVTGPPPLIMTRASNGLCLWAVRAWRTAAWIEDEVSTPVSVRPNHPWRAC